MPNIHTPFDPELRDFNEKMLLKAINAAAAKAAAPPPPPPPPPAVTSPPYIAPTGQQRQQARAETAGSGWLDKVVLYTALVLAIVGFGFGFAATSNLESWQPLVGAVVGAAVGFAAPFGLRRAVEAVVEFIDENLPQLLALVVIMGLGAIGYLVLLS